MSDKKKMTREELEQAQGGVGGIKDLHDRPGTDPVPQQRATGFGKVEMSGPGGEIGEGELRRVKGGTALPLAGGEPKSTKKRDGTHDIGECGTGVVNDIARDGDVPPNPLKPHR